MIGNQICKMIIPSLAAVILFLTACDDTASSLKAGITAPDVTVTAGEEEYDGFTIDNVMSFSDIEEDLHYQLYVPDGYDGSEPYALYIALPGHGGYLEVDSDAGDNIRQESFALRSTAYNDKMIVAAPQLSEIADKYEDINDEFNVHSEQVIKFTEYLLANYNIDLSKVYISGYSRGGRVMSVILTKRPDLYSAALDISSKWEGDEAVIVKNRLPIYFVIGENDESFGSDPFRETYEKIISLYEQEGLTPEEAEKLTVLDIKDSDYFSFGDYDSQHLGADLFAFDDNVMNWLVNHDI